MPLATLSVLAFESPQICLEERDTETVLFSSVWYFNVCGHFILALQTSSANSRSSVTTLIISKLTRHPALSVKPVPGSCPDRGD